MSKRLRVFWIALATAISLQSAAIAGFDEGVIALDRGDFKAALYEFRHSAALGDARAQYNLAVMYRTGRGVDRNYQEAKRWYHNAAELGNVDAQFSLGVMYQEGMVGKMYVKGSKGLKYNLVKAHMWFDIAAWNGHRRSKENLGVVQKYMPQAEIARARALAKDWRRSWPIVTQRLDYSEQVALEKTMKRACVKKQKSKAVNAGFEDWQMEEFCDCSARYVSSNLQVSDVVYMTKRQNYNRRTRDLLEVSAQKCMVELRSKWGVR
jgi:TPR repeat protein